MADKWVAEDSQTVAEYLPEFDAVRIIQVDGRIYVDIDDWRAIGELFPSQSESG